MSEEENKTNKENNTEESTTISLEEALSQIEELKNKNLYLQADIQNQNRKHQVDMEQQVFRHTKKIIESIIPTLDTFDQSMRMMDEKGNEDHMTTVIDGVKMIQKTLLNSLKQIGVEEISSEGTFDPNFHEAIKMENIDDMEDNHIVMVYEKGYVFKDKVIRASRVSVNKK